MRKLKLTLLLAFASVSAFAQTYSNIPTFTWQRAPTAQGYVYRANMGALGFSNWYTKQQIDSLLNLVPLGDYYTKVQADARFVHLSGIETISGAKTWTGIQQFNALTYYPYGSGFNFGNQAGNASTQFRLASGASGNTTVIFRPLNDTVAYKSDLVNYAPATGGSGYIQNQNSSDQNANFNITGVGIAYGGLLGGNPSSGVYSVIDAGGYTHNSGSNNMHLQYNQAAFNNSGNGSAILINPTNTTFNSNKDIIFQGNSVSTPVAPVNANDLVRLSDIANFAPASGSANYIQNQYSAAQTADIWTNGRAKFSDSNGSTIINSSTISILSSGYAAVNVSDGVTDNTSLNTTGISIGHGSTGTYTQYRYDGARFVTNNTYSQWLHPNSSNINTDVYLPAGSGTLALTSDTTAALANYIPKFVNSSIPSVKTFLTQVHFGQYAVGTNLLDAVSANSKMNLSTIDNSASSSIQFGRAFGTPASPVIPTSAVNIGKFEYFVTTGATTSGKAAEMRVDMNSTPSTTSTPGDIYFATTTTGSLVTTDRVRISAAGNVHTLNGGGITINSTTAPIGGLDIYNGSGFVGVFGAASDNSRTTATNKVMRFGMPAYTTAQNPVTVFFGNATNTENIIGLGGGTASGQAATRLNFYTASALNTATGTVIGTITSNGWRIGDGTNPGATADIAGTLRVSTSVTQTTANTYSTGGYSPLVRNSTTGVYETIAPAQLPTTTKTGNYTATTSDYTIRVDCTSGAVNITLPTASTVTGIVYNIKKIDATANAVTIIGVIDGVTNPTITTQYANKQIQSNGTTYDNL